MNYQFLYFVYSHTTPNHHEFALSYAPTYVIILIVLGGWETFILATRKTRIEVDHAITTTYRTVACGVTVTLCIAFTGQVYVRWVERSMPVGVAEKTIDEIVDQLDIIWSSI